MRVNFWRKTISMVLAGILLLGGLGEAPGEVKEASAAEIPAEKKAGAMTTVINGTEYVYRYRDDSKSNVEITAIYKAAEELVIPAKLDGHPVYGIYGFDSENAMQYDESTSKVQTIKIESGVKEIGFEAFPAFSKLKTVVIPKSVKKIGASAFRDDSKITSITFKNPNIKISDSAFVGCRKLKKITWPKGTFKGSIGKSAFEYCDIRTLIFPYMKNMKKQIGRFAFADNKKLKKITFSNKYKKITIGADWFTDCPKSQIVVGKNVKTFSSKVNANAGSVRLLGKKTKLTGFSKVELLRNPFITWEKYEKLEKAKKTRYYIQYTRFIVPKKSKALGVLKRAYYGVVDDDGEDRYSGAENSYYNSKLKKVKVTIK